MKTSTKSPAQMIDARIKDLGDWRGATLARIRTLIKEAVPEVVEEWKWMGTPVWEHGGIICTGESYKAAVKMTFAKGAFLDDPSGLFNSSLDGNLRRAIDIHEGETIDAPALKALFRAAAALNLARKSPARAASATSVKTAKPKSATSPRASKARTARPKAKAKKSSAKTAPGARPRTRVALLSGGNPQIAMAGGDAPVQAYIAAMPGWKRAVGTRLDALIERSIPDVQKAVKWNSPFYGIDGLGWFLSLHTFTRYVKVAFFRGTSLRPLPPGASKSKDTRYLDIREADELDEAQLASWVKQAAALPGFLS